MNWGAAGFLFHSFFLFVCVSARNSVSVVFGFDFTCLAGMSFC